MPGLISLNSWTGLKAEDQVMMQIPSMLVAIASHGIAQDHYLYKVLSEYRNIRAEKRIVVLCDRKKRVDGAEVLVGLPSRNPYSLPFGHRKLFADNADRFELFIYTEDDTLLTIKHIESFLWAHSKLRQGEIEGFIRSETSPDGKEYITSINSFFRWLPDTVVNRDGELFAELSNQHSGCFIVTRKQLEKAIESGGFLVKPHSEFYGMLETAASDIYTQCGLRRLICISRIRNFIVPHLSNKYFSQMGVSIDELEFQAMTLCDLSINDRWRGKLFDPESKAPGFRWSKNLYDTPDMELLKNVPLPTKNLLCVGSSTGENEAWLSAKGINVCAVPIDGVFGAYLRRRGIETVEGTLDLVINQLNGRKFDVVLMAEVLHLVEKPVEWLEKIGKLVIRNGIVIASVSNTREIPVWVNDWLSGRRRSMFCRYEDTLTQTIGCGRFRRMCRKSGLELVRIEPVVMSSKRAIERCGKSKLMSMLASKFIFTAVRIS
jgi:SAM-dependent methyltransferase